VSRTHRKDPGGCWMRTPRHKAIHRDLEATDAELRAEGLPQPHRNAKPPTAWDDLIVSYRRGQPWSRHD
jgi:hypothetical protein